VRSDASDPTCRDGTSCDLDTPTSCLTSNQLTNFNGLQEELGRIMSSQTSCQGDGNLDLRVDQRDNDGVASFSTAVSPLTGDRFGSRAGGWRTR
jgi:hypothetical protein